MQLLTSITQINRQYLLNLPCVCEEKTEEMEGAFVCPRHGYREPRYDLLDRTGGEDGREHSIGSIE